MCKESETMWGKANMVEFEVLSWNFFDRTGEKHEMNSENCWNLGTYSNMGPSKHEKQVLPT